MTIVVHRGAGAYICGEETALLESLEGKRGQPRSKPPFPAISGLYASPTVVNNVETIATVAPIIAMGGAEYAKLGVENSRGTRVVSISGNVVNGGNYEIEPGMSLREIIYDLGGGIPDGRELKAVVPGGSSTVILTKDEIDVGYDFDSLAQLRTAMGSAGIVVLDDRCCIVQLGIRFSEFYEHESCGKCTPCREGTRWLTAILRKLEDGRATQGDLDLLLDVCDRINGKCLCPLGDSDAIIVASLRREVPRRVRRAHRATAAARSAATRPSTTCWRRSRCTRTRRWPRCPHDGNSFRPRHGHDRRADGAGAEGHRHGRDGAAAGIEIPVFCYEPRLGPPVGACRMCLVEVEGMPKLQAGCTLTAQDGMVVQDRALVGSRRPRARTRRSSSSSSTTRSTAPSATRAASARCRT